jgi:hypothetical protein
VGVVPDHELAILRPFSLRLISIPAGETRNSVRLPGAFAIHHCLASFGRLARMKLDTRLIARLSSESE